MSSFFTALPYERVYVSCMVLFLALSRGKKTKIERCRNFKIVKETHKRDGRNGFQHEVLKKMSKISDLLRIRSRNTT